VKNQRALSGLHVGRSAIIAAGVFAVMLLAGEETVRGAMTVGDLVLVNAYVIQICLPLNALGFVFREAKDALVNTEVLFKLLGQVPDIQDRPDAMPLAVRGGAVAFEHVEFAYEPGRQILYDLSLSMPAGSTVAVVGGSGSGKSTPARVLPRLYEVAGGRIPVDDQDLRRAQRDIARFDRRGSAGHRALQRHDRLQHRHGRPDAGMSGIVEAAKAAQVHEFILPLPQQYDTVVGERGLELSGGEKQRIAIARAFLGNPPIMVFDEATSALDTRAERAIQNELDRMAQGRTSLVIAHRLSTIVNADEILVMDKGRIVERGRHDALLAQKGLYAQLWALQRQQREFETLEETLARSRSTSRCCSPAWSTACARRSSGTRCVCTPPRLWMMDHAFWARATTTRPSSSCCAGPGCRTAAPTTWPARRRGCSPATGSSAGTRGAWTSGRVRSARARSWRGPSTRRCKAGSTSS
jgi:ATP-binding cassette subfamily B protein